MKLLVHFCFFIVFFFPDAKIASGQRMEIGIKAGGSMNYAYGPGTERYSLTPTTGVSGGAYATYFLSEKIRLRAEALASTRGFKAQSVSFETSQPTFGQPVSPGPTTTQPSSSGSSYYSLNKQALYVDVPVGLDYQLMPRIFVQAGGVVSFFMQEYKNTLSSSYTINQKEPEDVRDYQPMQLSLYGGASYRFDFGLAAGARATLGMTNTFVASSQHADSQILPYSFQVFVSYPLLKF